MVFHFITLFPDTVRAELESSILGRALRSKKISARFWNPRDYTTDKHRTVDDRPYGGGPGMVLKVEPVVTAATKALAATRGKKAKVLLLSPRGRQFTNALARTWSAHADHLILIAGHYEGIDARVRKILKAEEISVGPYVLTGGELPALIIADAVARQIPGVLGKGESREEERVASGETYTRPEVFTHKGKQYRVPKVLLSGDQKKIDAWRRDR